MNKPKSKATNYTVQWFLLAQGEDVFQNSISQGNKFQCFSNQRCLEKRSANTKSPR